MDVLKGILFFFAVIGIIQSIVWVQRQFLRPRSRVAVRLVIPLRGHVADLEQIIRYYRHQMEWNRYGNENMKLVLQDCGLDEESRDICQRFAEQYAGVSLSPNSPTYEESF